MRRALSGMLGTSSAENVAIHSTLLLLSLNETAMHTAFAATPDVRAPDVAHVSSRFWMSARWKLWEESGTKNVSFVTNAKVALAMRDASS